jgi:hypothetical protein
MVEIGWSSLRLGDADFISCICTSSSSPTALIRALIPAATFVNY